MSKGSLGDVLYLQNTKPLVHRIGFVEIGEGGGCALPRGLDKKMRVFLKDTVSTERLLEELVQACGAVLEGSVPECRRSDLNMGIYVAMRQVLSQSMVKNRTCGSLPECEDMKEESPFESTLRVGARAS